MLTEKVAIVTGASRGIGQAVALELARGGAATLLAARTDKACEPVAAGIRREGGRAEIIACDVSRYADAQRLAETALEHYGRIDILVNNAGVIEPISTLETCEPDTWTQNIAVNLVGVFHCCRAVLPRFRQAGGGGHHKPELWRGAPAPGGMECLLRGESRGSDAHEIGGPGGRGSWGSSVRFPAGRCRHGDAGCDP